MIRFQIGEEVAIKLQGDNTIGRGEICKIDVSPEIRFPLYAVKVKQGIRLNILFARDILQSCRYESSPWRVCKLEEA